MRPVRILQCHVPGDAQGGDVLTMALSTNPALRLHQGAKHFPDLQPWRQLGCIPGGQGNAFSKQISMAGLSLPVECNQEIHGSDDAALLSIRGWHPGYCSETQKGEVQKSPSPSGSSAEDFLDYEELEYFPDQDMLKIQTISGASGVQIPGRNSLQKKQVQEPLEYLCLLGVMHQFVECPPNPTVYLFDEEGKAEQSRREEYPFLFLFMTATVL
ncbi:hypothetical protein WISP_93791 [Willisornis vidua]|uniref:Uncharacterized protein n=1 Tax=Willisornis vidua TaxID=1566151 RepID=A0ABQ9D644_9PASS|nr:hypothetical protein WISP_93791 [Willisornis vidua]